MIYLFSDVALFWRNLRRFFPRPIPLVKTRSFSYSTHIHSGSGQSFTRFLESFVTKSKIEITNIVRSREKKGKLCLVTSSLICDQHNWEPNHPCVILSRREGSKLVTRERKWTIIRLPFTSRVDNQSLATLQSTNKQNHPLDHSI